MTLENDDDDEAEEKWTQNDRKLVAPSIALVKAAQACIKKVCICQMMSHYKTRLKWIYQVPVHGSIVASLCQLGATSCTFSYILNLPLFCQTQSVRLSTCVLPF